MKSTLTACPFCGGRLVYDRDDRFAIFHSMPTCAKWDESDDSLAFVIEVRKALGLPSPDRN